MEKVRMAIIGVGAMGKKYAMYIFQNQIRNMELTALVCRNEAARDWAEAQFGDTVKIFESSQELYNHTEYYDGVLIVTPHKEHPRLAKEAFSKGIHVFVDKPAGVYTKEVRELNEIANKVGKAYAIMFHKRSLPIYKYIKELIEVGGLGKINRVTWTTTNLFRSVKYHQSSPWRSSWKGEGGGLLMNQAQHPLDLWQWFFGMPKTMLGLIDFGKYNDFAVDDNGTLIMEYEDGMRGIFISSTGEGVGEERIEIVGNGGRLVLENEIIKYWKYEISMEEIAELGEETGVKVPYVYEERKFDYSGNPYIEMLGNFSDHILYKHPLIAKGDDGIHALELANAAYLSAWEDEKISFPIQDDVYFEVLKIKIDEEEKSAKNKK